MIKQLRHSLTLQIFAAMAAGLIMGLVLHGAFHPEALVTHAIQNTLHIGGQLFMNALKMLVVPVVFISLVCGMFALNTGQQLASLVRRTVILYMMTTAAAICLALLTAYLTGVGTGYHLAAKAPFELENVPGGKDIILGIIPTNPMASLVEGNMLQIIVFALLFGYACNQIGDKAKTVKALFDSAQSVIMYLVTMVIKLTPIGVFCLVANVVSETGMNIFQSLAGSLLVIIIVLLMQLLLTYGLLLRFYAKLNPYYFFRHMVPAMLFAFSTSSSAVSIPIVLQTVKEKLGVDSSIASFVIPLGATINMDGTAIMQGVATVFIANTYGIDLSLLAYLQVILIATLASIGTAAIPGIGLITLTMVLTQVGLPVEGIALIIGVDRIIDMSRTAVNVAGDAMVSCAVASKGNQLNTQRYEQISPVE